MSQDQSVVAIACADLHLSHNPPAARAQEKSWYVAMARPLSELRNLSVTHAAPVFCAGDIFHHWKSPPELINFAIDKLPTMYAIPGQHDLPLHSHEDLEKSAYATLMKAGKIRNVQGRTFAGSLSWIGYLFGAPWGMPVQRPDEDDEPAVLLQHAYRWSSATGHPGATQETYVNPGEYEGYGTVIIGDNHKSWDVIRGGTHIFNCGSLMRRNCDQFDHRPRVGLIMSDGSVQSHYLDCSADVLDVDRGVADETRIGLRVESLLGELNSLRDESLDFPEMVRRAVNVRDVTPAVRKVLLAALEIRS